MLVLGHKSNKASLHCCALDILYKTSSSMSLMSLNCLRDWSTEQAKFDKIDLTMVSDAWSFAQSANNIKTLFNKLCTSIEEDSKICDDFRNSCKQNPKMIITFFLHLKDDATRIKFHQKLQDVMKEIIPFKDLLMLCAHRDDKDKGVSVLESYLEHGGLSLDEQQQAKNCRQLLYGNSSDKRTTLQPSAHFLNPYVITPLTL